MKKHIPEKLYSLLTGEERFRLYIEALCRGDEAEAKHLIESCPPRNLRDEPGGLCRPL